MMEVLESYEALESTLNLRDRLEQATEPLEVIAVVSAAIQAIRGWNHEHDNRFSIQVSDRLYDIHAHTKALYKEIVIPRDYRSWWREAQEELDAKAQRYTEALQKLRTMPSETKQQRRAVREEQFGVSTCVSHDEFEASINDPAAFAVWKQQMEGWTQEIIDDCDRVRKRLAENAPPENMQATEGAAEIRK